MVLPSVGACIFLLLLCCKKYIIDFICCRRYCPQCKNLSHCGHTSEYSEIICNCNHPRHFANRCEGKLKEEKKVYKDIIKSEKYTDYIDEFYDEETKEIESYKETPRQNKKKVGTKKVTKYKDVVVGQKEEKYEENGIVDYRNEEYEENGIVDYQDEEYEEEVFDKYETVTNREYKYIRTDLVPKTETEYYNDTETYTDYENKERYVSKPFFGYRTKYVNGNPITEAYTEYKMEREVDYNVPVTKTRQVRKSKQVIKYENEKVFDWVTTETQIPKMKFITKTKSVPVYGMIRKTKSVPVYGMIKKTRMVDVIESKPYEIDEDIIEIEIIVDKTPIYKVVRKQRKKPVEKFKQVVENVYVRTDYINVSCQCKINNGHKECKKCSCSRCTRIIDINTPLITISIK